MKRFQKWSLEALLHVLYEQLQKLINSNYLIFKLNQAKYNKQLKTIKY